MYGVALRMLLGDPAKYVGLIVGITFATMLMSNQVSMFLSLMLRTASQIEDVYDADIWVMDGSVRQVDEVESLPAYDLLRIRSVPGVSWAMPFFKGLALARSRDGRLQQVTLLGVDDASLAGGPHRMLAGRVADLHQPDAVLMDRAGWDFIWPGQPFESGRTVELNDKRAVIAGLCDALPPFTTYPVVYAKISDAIRYSEVQTRKPMPFIIAKVADPASAAAVAREINRRTGLRAMTDGAFARATILYYMIWTGIPVNFAITVGLGFLVGAVIVGQTLYIFILENLRQFGALKAMGAGNRVIVRMVLLQGAVVAAIGYGLGIGATGVFFFVAGNLSDMLRGFRMTWDVLVGTGFAVAAIVVLASLASIRRVLHTDPAIVFRA